MPPSKPLTLVLPLQQHLPPAVCAEGCETAEEQSDDEVRTSQVPERREGKTKMMKQQHLPPAVLKLHSIVFAIVHRYKLQQHLPLAVLKLTGLLVQVLIGHTGCNNTYRSRY